ncbi:MAG TPA: hypothetical protein VJZ31_03195 [Bacilli bacterium]|nr:hypothetical protein [Bacilli bacterium]
MTSNIMLLKLSETDKRLIIVIFLLLILIFVLFGVIYDSVKVLMDKQGKKIDALMSLPIASGLIMNRKQFKKIAHYKNDVQFYKTFSRVIALLLVTGILHLVYHLIMQYVYQIQLNLWATETGFSTIIYTFDWANMPRSTFFGITLPSDWPAVTNRPHFVPQAIGSYVIFPLYVVAAIGAFMSILAYLSRTLRVRKLANSLFSADLTNKRIHDLGALDQNKNVSGINVPEDVSQPVVKK